MLLSTSGRGVLQLGIDMFVWGVMCSDHIVNVGGIRSRDTGLISDNSGCIRFLQVRLGGSVDSLTGSSCIHMGSCVPIQSRWPTRFVA